MIEKFVDPSRESKLGPVSPDISTLTSRPIGHLNCSCADCNLVLIG